MHTEILLGKVNNKKVIYTKNSVKLLDTDENIICEKKGNFSVLIDNKWCLKTFVADMLMNKNDQFITDNGIDWS